MIYLYQASPFNVSRFAMNRLQFWEGGSVTSKIIIRGGKPLYGEVAVSGMKNSALPIIFATLLVHGQVTLHNVPKVSDTIDALKILFSMGASVETVDNQTVKIDTAKLIPGTSPLALVSRIRASCYLLGAELGRFGQTKVAQPGGCNFGKRPLDIHLSGFQALGATVEYSGEFIFGDAIDGLKGTGINLRFPSVGATVNMLLAAVTADGTTVLSNAAREPHIADLCRFLIACGADISGVGSSTLTVRGVSELRGCEYTIAPDMIEAGTYMAAVAAAGGSLRLTGIVPDDLVSTCAAMADAGALFEIGTDHMIIRSGALRAVTVSTEPFPGFPTDMHPQLGAMLCCANGTSAIFENIFDNRFQYVDELQKMGANVIRSGNKALITGVPSLHGAKVNAVDLRAGAALVIAALCAEGTTEITGVDKIERGYNNIVGNLKNLGADVTFIEEDEPEETE